MSGSLPWSPAPRSHGKRQQTRRQIGSVGGESGNLSQTDMGILATPAWGILSRPTSTPSSPSAAEPGVTEAIHHHSHILLSPERRPAGQGASVYTQQSQLRGVAPIPEHPKSASSEEPGGACPCLYLPPPEWPTTVSCRKGTRCTGMRTTWYQLSPGLGLRPSTDSACGKDGVQ